MNNIVKAIIVCLFKSYHVSVIIIRIAIIFSIKLASIDRMVILLLVLTL